MLYSKVDMLAFESPQQAWLWCSA